MSEPTTIEKLQSLLGEHQGLMFWWYPDCVDLDTATGQSVTRATLAKAIDAAYEEMIGGDDNDPVQ